MQAILATFLSAAVLTGAGAHAGDLGAAVSIKQPLQLHFSQRLHEGARVLGLTIEERRQNAVSMAREDKLAAAVRVLSALHRRTPGDEQVLFDLISVLNWQGNHERVLDLASRLESDNAPDYAVEAVAGSARKSGNFKSAIRWYEIGLEKAPESVPLNVGLALSHADAGDPQQARAAFLASPLAVQRSLEGMLADAYLRAADGRHFEALTAYDRVLALHATSPAAQRGKFRALRALLLVDQALEFAASHPGVATHEDVSALHVDRAALWVRWGVAPVLRGSERFADLDQAIALLQQNLQRHPADSMLGRTTRFDLMAALHARGAHDDVVRHYEDLGFEDSQIPAYALRAVAGSRLARREPAEALRLYDLALGQQGANFELNFDRFFALVELDRHAEARQLAEELVFSQDIWLTVPGSRVVKPNPRRLKAEITRALSHAYADDLETAQSEFQTMLAEAPHNTDVRQELGNVYRWRGWPRRALFEYQQVFTVEDDLLSARTGLANSLLDLGIGPEFEALLAELKNEQPKNAGVKRLVRRHELYHRNEISADGESGSSSGEQFGTRQHLAQARLSLGGFGYRWRPFLSLHDSRAEFSEGTSRRKTAGLGIEYRRPGQSLTASLSRSFDDSSRTGVALAYSLAIDDRWGLDGLLESESHALPLRAYRNGISADRIRIGGGFRHSELFQARASVDVMDFSDGNLRKAMLFEARRRFLNASRLKIDLLAGLYASKNSLSNASYFNPSSDRAISLSSDLRWRLFRRYERNFDQQLIVSAGRYRQSGFPTGSVGSIEFRQAIQLSHALEFFVGVRRARALYDGGLEYGTFYQGGLRGRF